LAYFKKEKIFCLLMASIPLVKILRSENRRKQNKDKNINQRNKKKNNQLTSDLHVQHPTRRIFS
jgi:hypothetical protein